MKPRGFTLIELLVVIGILGVLAAILLPALAGAKEQARSAVCMSNLRQLAMAALAYADEHNDFFPPSSWDIMGKNLHRWHGRRNKQNQPFDFTRSPLHPYLQTDRIKACPDFERFLTGFEAGCGGYGYNDSYVGSSRGIPGDLGNRPAQKGSLADPGHTVLFADCAFLQNGKLIEYSFVTEPEFEAWGGVHSTPTVHFRHNGRANVAWADGHVSSEPLGFTWDAGPGFRDHEIGYIGEHRDNRLYDRD